GDRRTDEKYLEMYRSVTQQGPRAVPRAAASRSPPADTPRPTPTRLAQPRHSALAVPHHSSSRPTACPTFRTIRPAAPLPHPRYHSTRAVPGPPTRFLPPDGPLRRSTCPTLPTDYATRPDASRSPPTTQSGPLPPQANRRFYASRSAPALSDNPRQPVPT